MANTVIQLKYSTVTSTPPSLNVAEPAYSYASNTFFVGSPDGTGVIAVGGQFYMDKFQRAFDKANAAFDTANSAGSSAFAQGAYNTANAAFASANSINGVDTTQNTSITAAFTAANSAGVYANGAFASANNEAGVNATQNTNITTAQNTATAAFIRANNSISANAGGTITGDLNVTGNLTIGGNTSFINTEILTVEDSLIKLANNNTTGDVLDIGFYGLYNSSGQKYAGLARPAATDTFFLFKGLTQDPTANALASGSVTAANAATLIANVQAYSVTINGQDIQTYATNAYNTANAAFTSANNINGVNTTQNNSITAAFVAANSAGVYANGAFDKANSAYTLATGTAGVANTDYTTITTTAGYYGNGATISSFTLEANGRISQANSTLIGIAASQVTVGTLAVARGGTGAGSFTNNGVLLGQGTSAFATASSSTEGHVLTINASGVPTFAYLQGGTF